MTDPAAARSAGRATPRAVWMSLAASVAVGVGLRVWGLGFGLPYTQARPDETQIIDVILKFLRGELVPKFVDYPWAYMYVSAVVHLLRFAWSTVTGHVADLTAYVASWPIHWPPFFYINRGISAVSGSLTILAVFALGRRVGGDAVASVGAFFMAVAFLAVRESHYGTTDSMMVLFCVLCVVALLRAADERRVTWYVVAGVCAGLAAGTKYNGLGLGAAILTAQVIEWRRRDGAGWSRWPLWTAGVPFLVVFLLCVPFVYLDYPMFREQLALLYRSLSAGPGAGQEVVGENGWWVHLRLSLRHGLGVPLFTASLVGAAVMTWVTPTRAVILLAFPLAYFGVAGSSGYHFFRYALPMVPFLCVTAAYLTVQIVHRWVTWPRPWVVTLASCLTMVIAAPSFYSAWRFDQIMSQTDNRVLVQEYIESYAGPGTSILQSGSRYGLAHFRGDKGYRRWVWDGPRRAFVVDGRRAEGRPDLILVQESPVRSMTQPVVLEYLRDGYVFVKRFQAFSAAERSNLYDMQDAFFVPYAGFARVERPGPNFDLYRRVGQPFPNLAGPQAGPR